jgi:linoleate 8R-lipoxygenase/9,12-octadecadienoate 8-hydroperoxide 8R-isomerase
MLTVYSFMEGARLRCSVALPRFVSKPATIEDNGQFINLKAGQEVLCNLVSPYHLPDQTSLPVSTRF